MRFFFLRSDRVQGGFFTKITFPKGFWITRKTDGGEGRDSEPFCCVSPPYTGRGQIGPLDIQRGFSGAGYRGSSLSRSLFSQAVTNVVRSECLGKSSSLEMRLGSADTSRKPPVLALQNIAALYIDQGTRQLLCETVEASVFKASVYVPCFCFLISIVLGLPNLQIKMNRPKSSNIICFRYNQVSQN